MSVLWSKVWRDLFQNRARAITIVLTIALGVFALGVVINLYVTLNTQMVESLGRTNPSHIHAPVAAGLNRAQAQRLGRIPGVAAVEAVTISGISWKKPGDADWSDGILIARENYSDQVMDLITLDAGAWPGALPGQSDAGMERLTARYFDLGLGSSILVRTGGNSQQTIPLTGIIRSIQDLQPPRSMGGKAVFYVTSLTMMNLTGIAQPNRVNVQLTHFDADTAQTVAAQIKDQLNLSVAADIADPAKPRFQGELQALCMVLAAMGIGILGLSILLIINVFNAIMLQQVRQIGSMKTIGADTGQIMRVYLSISLVYGAISVLLAMPLATLATQWLSNLLLSLLSIDPQPPQIIPLAWGVQAGVGLLAPTLAALFPVWAGARITVRQAIQNYGVSAPFGHGWLEKGLLKLQGISMSWAISARNTLRNKQRSLLTLAMMIISGLLFMSVMSVKGAFQATFLEMSSAYQYDVEIDPASPQRVTEMRSLAEEIPGVVYAEMFWSEETTFRFSGANERTLTLDALPPDSKVYIPKMVAGRWLEMNDTQALVLNSKIAEEEGIHVGDFITMTSAVKPIQWQVVGLNFDLSNNQRLAFVPLDSFAAIKNQNGFATALLVQTTDHSDATQSAVQKALVDLYKKHNIALNGSTAVNIRIAQNLSQFDILIYLLIAMSILMAAVGGLGLMGSMFLNVAERRREIGVMRAIGGDSSAIAQIFVNEGVTLGFLSWLVTAALSAPASSAFANALGVALFSFPLKPSFSWLGIGLWLLIVLGLSALASAWPAWQAARASVRDSLTYE
ncbi:MAG: ABC transporter permease [Anaerolineales bacterium]